MFLCVVHVHVTNNCLNLVGIFLQPDDIEFMGLQLSSISL